MCIGLVLLLALAACTKAPELAERPAPALLQIDSLMWQRPDSALALLLPYFDTCRDAMIASPTDDADNALETHSMRLYDRHYANLLLAELLYKNDFAQANRAELQQAVAYFDSLVAGADAPRVSADNATIAFLDARAHYINGVGYYEQDSLVEACREYLKALEIMENRFEEKDLVGEKARFMALTHTHLCSLFSDMYLHEQAIYFGEEALEYYQKYNATPWHISWVLNEIGSHYEMMDDYDSADYYYHQSLLVLSDTNSLTYRDIVTHIAFLSYKMGGSPIFSLRRLQKLIEQSETQGEALSRCAMVGEIFYHEKQFDSAFVYSNEVYNYSNSMDSRKQAAEWLVEICEAQGREADAIEYATFLVPFANLNENQSFLKSQLTELCHEYEQKKQETLHQNKLKETLRKGGFIIWGLVLAFSVGLSVYLFINKRRMAAERQAHKMQQAALSGKLKKSNEALRETTKQLEKAIAEKEISGPALAKDYASFREAPICRQILETVKGNYFKSKMDCSAYKEYALGKEQLQSLRDSADEHMAQFTTRLRKQFPSLNEEDVNYCCLYLLGLNEAEISVLMQRAYPTVCERNRKIRRIIGEKNDLVFALRNF